MDEELMQTQVMLRFGYHFKVVIRMEAAMRILALLSNENMLLANTEYSSGKSTEVLQPWGTEEVTITLVSPAEILLRCAAAERAKEAK